MRRRIDIKGERGVAMTEFALVLPVFVLIIAGLLAFGRVFFYWIETNHLASETARWAIVDRNPYATTLQEHVRTSNTTEFSTDVAVCIDYPDSSYAAATIGDRVRVRIQKPFRLLPLMNMGTITIRGASTMRIERIAGADPLANPSNNIGTCT